MLRTLYNQIGPYKKAAIATPLLTAMEVVSRLIERNLDQQDLCLGIPIEKCLDLL